MIASILEVLGRARSGATAIPPAAVNDRSGLTRGSFLRVAMIGGMSLGAAAGQALAAGSRSRVAPVSDLDKLYDAWQSRFNAADIEGMVDLYVADVTFVNPEGKLLSGKAAVRADFLEAFKLKLQISIQDRKHLIYKGIALTTNHWTMKVPNADGSHQTMTGGGIEVMQRQADGGWRYVIDDASRSAS